MRRAAVENAQVHVGASGLRKALKKVFHQFRLKIADAFCGEFCLDNAETAATEIDGGGRKGFVHGHQEIAGAENAFLVAKRGVDSFAEGNAHVFDGVMLIHVQVALGGEAEIEAAVTRDEVEHVIKEGNARGNDGLAATIEIQTQ